MHFELRILLFRITFLWNHKSIRGKYALYGLNFLHSRCSNKHSDQNSNFATKTVEEIRFSIYRKLFTLPIAGIISFNWHDVLVVHHQYSRILPISFCGFEFWFIGLGTQTPFCPSNWLIIIGQEFQGIKAVQKSSY